MGTVRLEDQFAVETVNQLLSALFIEYNRCVLNYFRDSSERVASLDELAEYVAERQRGCDADSPEEVAIRLHHAGLPKLTDAGILDYDPRSKTVRCRDHPLIEAENLSEVDEVSQWRW